jgi:hypothetical protein
MPSVHTRYVTWVSRRRRHHGGTAEDLVAPLTTTAASGGAYQAWAPPVISWNGHEHTAAFAFWSTTGGSDGAFVSTDPSLTVPIGGGDVAATAWYLPGGGNGNGPGIDIDAFDVNLGDFVDDDFVDVVSDPSLTAAANEDGWVPTNSAQDVRAYGSIHAVPFAEWTVVAGSENVSYVDLQAAAQSYAVAFAFYQSPVRHLGPLRQYEEGTWVSWGVKVDAGGPTGHGPVPPWTPFIRELAAGFALAETATQLHPELRANVLRLAAEQVQGAAKRITGAMERGIEE